jgi:hypothetical protein
MPFSAFDWVMLLLIVGAVWTIAVNLWDLEG